MALFDDDDLLYHYTSAPVAVESILRTGELRLGQFAFTNDPRESRSWYMSASLPDGYDLETEKFMDLSNDADGMLRRSVKLACFTQGDGPRDDRGGVSGRGFAHSSLWSHYGGEHSGVCIGFRRDLLPHLKSQLGQLGCYYDGPVSYVDDASPPLQATNVGVRVARHRNSHSAKTPGRRSLAGLEDPPLHCERIVRLGGADWGYDRLTRQRRRGQRGGDDNNLWGCGPEPI